MLQIQDDNDQIIVLEWVAGWVLHLLSGTRDLSKAFDQSQHIYCLKTWLLEEGVEGKPLGKQSGNSL